MPPSPPCPLCGSKQNKLWASATDLEYLTTSQTFQYFKCPQCSCLFIHPVPVNKLSVIYPPNYYSFSGDQPSWVEKAKQTMDARWLRRILGRISVDQINILDVGGGTGWMLDLLKNIDPRVALTQVVDMDQKAAQKARAKGHRYFQGPIEAFATRQKFHLVLMFNLIEHVKDPIQVLQKIQKVLVPGGLLLVKTPNIDSWDAQLFRHGNWGGYHCPRHWVLFNETSFTKALGKTRLELLSLTYTQGAPFWTQSVMIGLYKRKLIHYTKEKPLVDHPLFPVLAAFFAGFDFLRGLFFKTSQMLILLRNPVK